ncbi:uncharacterized protein EI97DRAFT_482014 [Westerdykella ornata]|uniref:S-adenosyl-L-methionine-dependent methyltransferase n=1 Tax=Westerdykella ornata TaxID=318751 RepID=A0A6A6JT22_WESOR|nr:uncharacterized protein EI97DRAFT_482014 [Westerdykella ornata]KAF2279507.1 hypothetical protein EI97DRAFT_482014 [Westerdykella ornata]
MSISIRCIPPTSCLPPVRSIRGATDEQIRNALCNLRQLYCPLRRLSVSLHSRKDAKAVISQVLQPTDSGYASQDDDEDDETSEVEDTNATLRADTFERDFAVRWLTALIARAEELSFDPDLVDEAAFILASFSDIEDEGPDQALTRDFCFPSLFHSSASTKIEVRLNDAPLSTTDHTDVGLQSWGASIILSDMMCASPGRFGLEKLDPGCTIVELGAGTGLVSLTLAKMLQQSYITDATLVATDYHPAVLQNLDRNIRTNFPSNDTAPVKAMMLDWSAPVLAPPLDKPASMVVAADVIYAPEHATWLRDCAGLLLGGDCHFWLIVTVRTVGKFEGIADTVETAFSAADCPKKNGKTLQILEKEVLEKRKGIGRGDETAYNLYKIGWRE